MLKITSIETDLGIVYRDLYFNGTVTALKQAVEEETMLCLYRHDKDINDNEIVFVKIEHIALLSLSNKTKVKETKKEEEVPEFDYAKYAKLLEEERIEKEKKKKKDKRTTDDIIDNNIHFLSLISDENYEELEQMIDAEVNEEFRRYKELYPTACEQELMDKAFEKVLINMLNLM